MYASLWCALAILAAAPIDDDYLRAVKPVFEKRCYACHGALHQKASLRVDTAAAIGKGGRSGPAIEPGDADGSLLIEKVTETDPKLRMPPEGDPLDGAELAAIRSWIAAGAPAPTAEQAQHDPRDHWAFRPVVRPDVPDGGTSANPIDAFLAAAQATREIVPNSGADRATLLRRVSLDLTGLAPTPDELHAFLNDTRPDAYERVVERLLASPRYGERWGRHWMDVWRYSDWYGWQAEVRHSQPHIWRWRDWIVESLNDDKGYDRMIVEMLAGDELAPNDPNTVRATGYLVRNWFKFNRHVWLQDTVDHTAKAFLGLTMACARCHDHKYDPIAQADYYRLRAFFEPHDIRTDPLPGEPDTTKVGLVRVYDAHAETPTYLFTRGDDMQPVADKPLQPALPEFLQARVDAHAIELPPSSYYTPLRPDLRAVERERVERSLADAQRALEHASGAAIQTPQSSSAGLRAAQRLSAAQKQLLAAQASREYLEARIAADDARFARPPDSKRADIEAYRAGFLQRQVEYFEHDADLASAESQLAEAHAKPGKPDDATKRRIDELAKTIELQTSRRTEALAALQRDKPSKHYTPFAPVYPARSTGRRLALARWIADSANPLTARVAVNHVWMRHFGEPLVKSVFDFGNHGAPPTHPELLDWLTDEFTRTGWSLKHLHRLIVTSDAYRRSAAWSAESSAQRIDPDNLTLWRMNSRRLEAELVRDNVLWLSGTLDGTLGGVELDHNSALATNRRSLYYRHAPEKQAEFLKLFDAANMEACYRRDVSIVPQQALALSNSTLALASARRLAANLANEVGSDESSADDFVSRAFEIVLARPPRPAEHAACREFLTLQARQLSDPSGWQTFGEGTDCPVVASSNPTQRARENLVHALFNHNDFVTAR